MEASRQATAHGSQPPGDGLSANIPGSFWNPASGSQLLVDVPIIKKDLTEIICMVYFYSYVKDLFSQTK